MKLDRSVGCGHRIQRKTWEFNAISPSLEAIWVVSIRLTCLKYFGYLCPYIKQTARLCVKHSHRQPVQVLLILKSTSVSNRNINFFAVLETVRHKMEKHIAIYHKSKKSVKGPS